MAELGGVKIASRNDRLNRMLGLQTQAYGVDLNLDPEDEHLEDLEKLKVLDDEEVLRKD